MKKIEIDLDILKKNTIFAEEFLILSLIEVGENPRDFNWSFNLNDILDGLERELWVKPTEEGWILREKGRELFKDTSNKNDIDLVLTYLNAKTNKRFSITSSANRKFVSGRLDEGYTKEDMYHVIDTMVSRWTTDIKMRDYLRPETLFNATKFQTYYNLVPQEQRRVIAK